MKSINFEILRDKWPELANLGGFAEQYAHPDPPSSLLKLRSYAESLVHRIYQQFGLPVPEDDNLHKMLINEDFSSKIPTPVLNVLHSTRISGNKAAHAGEGTKETALKTLEDVFDLGRWYYILNGGKKEDCTSFKLPAKPASDNEINEIQDKLAEREAEMKMLLLELESARDKSQTAQKKIAELETLINAGQDAADALEFNEETTRMRLIDKLLADAGWKIGPNGTDTEEVTQEEEVKHQPTTTGIGYADYVLWDDNGKPLAVVEAKRTSVSAEQGKTQAQLYADGLEEMHGQRPVIFYTNGFEIFMWDDAQGYPPRSLFGYYSKDSLQYLHFQRSEKKELKTIKPDTSIMK